MNRQGRLGVLGHRLDRLPAWTHISRPVVTASIGGLLLAILLLAEQLDGVFRRPFDLSFWRTNLLGPVMVIYILITWPRLSRLRQEAIVALRLLSAAEADELNRILQTGERARWWRESAAFVVAALAGIALFRPWMMSEPFGWTRAYRVVATGLMFGLGGVVITSTLAGAHALSRLHRQPLRVDIWDASALEPIARRSLFLALFFVGGVTLGLLFIPAQTVQGLAVDAVVLVVAITVFFLSMWDTHVVMLQAKQRELQFVRARLAELYQDLREHNPAGGDSAFGSLSSATNLWLTYEKRIKEAPEWPFTNSTVRRLAASTLIPIVIIALQRIVVDLVVGRIK